MKEKQQDITKEYHPPRRAQSGQGMSALQREGYIAIGANSPPYEGEEEKGQISSGDSSSVFGSENEKMLSNSDDDEKQQRHQQAYKKEEIKRQQRIYSAMLDEGQATWQLQQHQGKTKNLPEDQQQRGHQLAYQLEESRGDSNHLRQRLIEIERNDA